MFADLYDALSFLWSWSWPAAAGQVTAVDVERIAHSRGQDTFLLAVAFKFSIGSDGPYTGETVWRPAYGSLKRVKQARRRIRAGQKVEVRYRADDPSINKLDRGTWQEF